jgi:broad-specificity NMP kinase
VGGPAGCGKTTFIEALLDAGWEWILAARCVRDVGAIERVATISPFGIYRPLSASSNII